MIKENKVSLFFLTRKELKDMMLLKSILDLGLETNRFYRLEINILPINYNFGFGSCKADFVQNLICLRSYDFWFNEDLEGIYGIIDSVSEISIERGKGYLLYGDGVVCHNMIIASLVKISE